MGWTFMCKQSLRRCSGGYAILAKFMIRENFDRRETESIALSLSAFGSFAFSIQTRSLLPTAM